MLRLKFVYLNMVLHGSNSQRCVRGGGHGINKKNISSEGGAGGWDETQ